MKKARVSKTSWSRHNLPDELWYEILLRLPAKSLLRFRCVSRSWKIWIDDPDFTRSHFNRFNHRPDSPILFVQGAQSECVVKNSETFRTSFSLGFLQSELESIHLLRTTPAPKGVSVKSWDIVSSIDGLFLLQGKDYLMLWNPAIRRTLPLPPLPAEIPGDFYPGLGFDPLIRKYKVVRFGTLRSGVRFAAIYTLGTNSWKIIDYGLAFHSWKSSIHFNGVLYGIARQYNIFARKLVSFDLRDEVFASFELPVPDQLNSKYYLTVVDNGCSLALVHVCESEGSIWTLEGLGDDTEARRWIQRYTFVTVSQHELLDYDFLCIKKNGEMLMKWYNKVICYNLETQQRKILMEKNRKSFKLPNTFTYMESLMLRS